MKFPTTFLKTWTDPWREYVSEFFGVSIFVFLVSSVVVSQSIFGEASLLTASFGIGFSYASVLYSTNHVSGGFLNPAVVISLWIVKRLSAVRAVFYVIAQLLGSVFGAILVWFAFGERAIGEGFGAPVLGLGVSVESAVVLEMILSAVFVFLIFALSINKTAPGVFGPLIFGLFLVVATLISYPISGASVNIIRSFGPIILSGEYNNLVVFVGGGLIGGLIGILYEYVFLRRVKK